MDLEDVIRELKSSGLVLRDHQIEGIKSLLRWNKMGHGGILADEMGLGKTCQGIIALTILASQGKGPSIVICPLSVLDHWENELIRFGCGQIKLVVYKGSKEERIYIQESLNELDWNVLLTTFDYYLKDNTLIDYAWNCMVLDEAHRVKNDMSLLHKIISQKQIDYTILFTGTPVQNNLTELYSLLQLVDRQSFPASELSDFLTKFKDLNNSIISDELKQILTEYVVRRTKKDVLDEVPKASEVILYHGITDIQKDVYKAILTTNHQFFQEFQKNTSIQSLQNVLVQLRKCVGHPYLFPDIEPKPFTEGEHLVETSGKMLILDVLLNYCQSNGHKVLLFSQMSKLLDIVQDILDLRKYKYVRIDGSVRGEERFHSIDSFQRVDSDVFIFLLTTKAGGVGLNLTAADTVIFLDPDFNPQNDLQAAARCHRIGQKKPVKIIKLIGQHTVEEIIKYRSSLKLRLSETILGEQSDTKKLTSAQISEMILHGLSKLSADTSETAARTKAISDEELEALIGHTDKNGNWGLDGLSLDEKENTLEDELDNEKRDELLSHKAMYKFEGHDYYDDQELKKDRVYLQELVKDQEKLTGLDKLSNSARAAVAKVARVRRVLTDEEKIERKKKLREKLEKKLIEQEKRKREYKKLLWKQNNYTSANLKFDMDADIPKVEEGMLYRIYGDVTQPERSKWDDSNKALILHSVDDGGHFGVGGVFSALDNLSNEIRKSYRMAGKMKDLTCGDAHIVKNVLQQKSIEGKDFRPEEPAPAEKDRTLAADNLDREVSVILMVTQTLKDRYQRIIQEEILKSCFNRIADWAVYNSASVHMPMIWYGVSNLSESYVCDLVQECFCVSGVNAYIYHFRRKGGRGGRQLPNQPQTAPIQKNTPVQISPKKLSNTNMDEDENIKEPLHKRRKVIPGAYVDLEAEENGGIEADEYIPEDIDDESLSEDEISLSSEEDFEDSPESESGEESEEEKPKPKRKTTKVRKLKMNTSPGPSHQKGLKKF